MAREIGNSNLLEVWATSGAVVEPDISKIEEGWQLGEQPPHEFMNWLQNTFGAKLNHILSNGAPEWNSTTSYTAGSLAKRTGNVWIAMQPNSNSEPAGGNVNWSRLLKVADIVDNLTTNDATKALSAAQGKLLQDKKLAKSANLSDLANAGTARTNLGLGTAASRDVGTVSGNVMEVGAFGLGSSGNLPSIVNINELNSSRIFRYAKESVGFPEGYGEGLYLHGTDQESGYANILLTSYSSSKYYIMRKTGGVWITDELYHTSNILTTTGQSTLYPMTQKATTDALNTKVGLSGNQTIAGVKTFSSSPIVPTPTANTQVANKKYVDDSAIGVGQTWQDVTGSRVVGTTYTNTTGKPIQLWFGFARGAPWSVAFTINGGIVSGSAGYCPIIPPGGTYSISATGIHSIKWLELR